MTTPPAATDREWIDSRDGGPYDDAAIRRYEERLAKEPDSLAFATLADLYRKAGRIAEAVALCREGLKRVPNYTTARLILAKSLLAAGDQAAALGELTALLVSSPADAQGHRILADVYRRRGDVDAAVRHLETAVRLDPADRESRSVLRLLQGGAPESAWGRVFRDDLFVTPTFGAICLEQGMVEEAAEIFTRLLRRQPGDQRALDGLERALAARTGRRRV